MNNQILAWFVAVVNMCFTSCMFAQPTISDLEEAWKDALSMRLPKGTHATWTEEYFAQYSVEEARSIIERYGADPTNEAVREARLVIRLSETGKLVSSFSLWYVDDSHYRVNEDTPQAEWSPIVDAAVDGTTGWIHAANGVVAAVDVDNPPSGRNPRDYASEIDGFVKDFLTGGLGRVRNAVFKNLERTGDLWHLEVTNADESLVYLLEMEYSNDHKQFMVLESRITSSTKYPDSVGSAVRHADYSYSDYLERMIPKSVVVVGSSGNTTLARHFGSASKFNSSDFASIARLPVDGDAVRGDITLIRLDDYRGNTSLRTDFDPQTGVEETSAIADDRPLRDRFLWNNIGWFVLAVLVLTFFVVRIRYKATS